MVGETVSIDTANIDQLKMKAAEWVPKAEDKSNGWRWNHPLEYVRKFQRARRGETDAATVRVKRVSKGSGKRAVKALPMANVEVKLTSDDGMINVQLDVSAKDPELKTLNESMKRLRDEQRKDEDDLEAIEHKEKALAIRKAEKRTRIEQRGPRLARLQAAIDAFIA